MEDNEQTAEELIAKYHQGIATPKERMLVEQWFLLDLESNTAVPSSERIKAADERISANLAIHINGTQRKKVVRLWPGIAVAAAAAAAIVFGVYFFNISRQSRLDVGNPALAYHNDIAPGKNGATITLADGKVIQLSDAKSGLVVGGGLKYSDGSDVRYSSGLQGAEGKGQVLMASTARGQTYQFTLPDGTKVWLNADSKLEFPSSFVNNKTRNVKLSGEAYFEVTKDKAHPFIVATDKQEVEVLGTHFNINSYADEGSVKTTLLEGSVRVAFVPEGAGNNVILKPNQQSVLTVSNRIKVQNVDPESAVDWKNGYFSFNEENLPAIMRKISRWYDVEISYQGNYTGNDFTGMVSRKKQVSEILKLLELTGLVHFKMEGRRITIMP